MDKTVTRPLTPVELDVISWIEHFCFNSKGQLPSDDLVKAEFPGFNYKEAKSDPTFATALINRGITAPTRHSSGLSNQQVAAVLTVANFADRRAFTTKLNKLGITAAQWKGWLNNPKFKAFLNEATARDLEDSLNVVHDGLLKASDKGDVNAIKFYMELTGRHKPENQTVINLQVYLSRIVESIQRHVSGLPDGQKVISAIAKDFETILKGEIPQSHGNNIVRGEIDGGRTDI